MQDADSFFAKLRFHLRRRRHEHDALAGGADGGTALEWPWVREGFGTASPDGGEMGMRPKSSRLHRSVSSVLHVLGVHHRVEQPVLEGTYYIDIVIPKPTTAHGRDTDAGPCQAQESASDARASSASRAQEIALEVDGPTHFVDVGMLPPDAARSAREPLPPAAARSGCSTQLGRDRLEAADGAFAEPAMPHLVLNNATLLKRLLLEKEGYQVVAEKGRGLRVRG